MSFGWSVGDICSAVALLAKAWKTLKNSDGAASGHQDTVEFLKSLVMTLESIQTVLEKYPELELKENLAEQANAMKMPSNLSREKSANTICLWVQRLAGRKRREFLEKSSLPCRRRQGTPSSFNAAVPNFCTSGSTSRHCKCFNLMWS